MAAPGSRLREDDEQGQHGDHRDHQKLVVVDVSNDLRLLRDHGVESGASGCGERRPELPDAWIVECPVDGCDVLHDVGVIDLRIPCQQAVHHRDAYARTDITRQAVQAGGLRPPGVPPPRCLRSTRYYATTCTGRRPPPAGRMTASTESPRSAARR